MQLLIQWFLGLLSGISINIENLLNIPFSIFINNKTPADDNNSSSSANNNKKDLSVVVNGNSNTNVVGDGNSIVQHVIMAPEPISASEYVDKALNDIDNWKHYEDATKIYFYNENFSDIRIVQSVTTDTEDYQDFWVRGFPAKSWGVHFYLVYKGQELGNPFRLIFVDGGRSLVIQPEIWSLQDKNTLNLTFEEFYLSYYFVKGSRRNLLNRIFQRAYPSSLQDERLNFPVFESEQIAKASFENDLKRTGRRYGYYVIKDGSYQYMRPSKN